MAQGLRLRRIIAVLLLIVLTSSAFIVTIAVPSPTRAASPPQTGSSSLDDFTQDTSLNTSLWQANGPLGSLVGPDVCIQCAVVPLQPTFSSSLGMGIAQANGMYEVGTIQSVEDFTPPFTTSAVVEGTVSHGMTFVFSIVSADASAGVAIYGDLNSTNCSHEGNCGDPAVCGITNPLAVPAYPAGQCYYGIDVDTATGNVLVSQPKLYLTPSLDVFYTAEISVNASGFAQYSISQGGQVLGESGTQIGTGPFYLILMQGEGWPDSGTGPNQAYWKSVSLNSPLTLPGLNVYPTESNFTTMTLKYAGQDLSSPIHVAVVKDTSFPLGLNVTLRAPGTSGYTKTLDLQPSDTGSSTIMLNVTLDCVTGRCDQPGGTQLPLTHDVNVTASSGSYRQEDTIRIHLLKAKWLVMLYAAADNNLQSGIVNNMIEMATVSKSNNNPAVGMLVLLDLLTGGSVPMAAPGTTPQQANTIRLYQAVNGTIKQIGDDWEETNSSDPATLHKFIDTAMTLIPADRNQLIIADHGGGIKGVAWDESDGNRPMLIPQLATALNGIAPKLDILSFDACLMAQVDVLYQLRNYATYFTASERTIPNPGYAYTRFLTSLLKNPDQSTLDYLNVIVSTYAAKYPEAATGGATLAAIDPSMLGGVVSSLNTLSGILVQHYRMNNAVFNATMLLVLSRSVYADAGYPYVDIRSFAQNILLNPQITDQSVKNAASAVIQATKAAVIANTTANIMYEGLTVLLWPQANVPKPLYQMFAGLDNQLSFSNSAHWLPLVQCVNRSMSLSTAAWILVLMVHHGHQLFLNVYDSTGGHTGINPSLLNESREEVELIPGSYYFELNSSATLIALPPGLGSFRTVVDGTSMTEASEPYTLTYTVVQNGTVASTKIVQGTMSQYTLQSANVTIQNGVLAVGATTVTNSAASTTTSTSSTTSNTSTTSSTTATSSSSSTSGKSSGIPEFPVQPGIALLVTIVIVMSYLFARRGLRADKLS